MCVWKWERSGQAGVVVILFGQIPGCLPHLLRPSMNGAFFTMVQKIRKKNNISWHMKIIWSSNLVSTDEAIVASTLAKHLNVQYMYTVALLSRFEAENTWQTMCKIWTICLVLYREMFALRGKNGNRWEQKKEANRDEQSHPVWVLVAVFLQFTLPCWSTLPFGDFLLFSFQWVIHCEHCQVIRDLIIGISHSLEWTSLHAVFHNLKITSGLSLYILKCRKQTCGYQQNSCGDGEGVDKIGSWD